MSASRRTYDTEMLTVRQVYAYNSNNTPIPALRTLTADGAGGTFWAIPSSLGGFPAFNTIVADGLPIPADLSFNRIHFSSAEGLGMVRNSTTKEIRYFSKCFSRFDVSGGNTLVGYSNNQVIPTVKFTGLGGIHISTDPLTNTMFFQGSYTSISTGIYSFYQTRVFSNVPLQTPNALTQLNSTILTATSPSSIVQFMGLGDMIFSTTNTSNAVYLRISTFTSRGYLDISGVAYGTFSSCLSTMSTLMYDIRKTGQATSSIMDSLSNVSIGIRQQFNYDEQNLLLNYQTKADFAVFSSFQLGINATDSSALSTVNRALWSTLTFVSSIGHSSNATTHAGVLGGSCNLFFSSVGFRLDYMSSLLRRANSGALINIYPSYSFNTLDAGAVGRIFYVSSMLNASNSWISSTTFVRPWMPANTGASNLYTDSIQFILSRTEIEASYTSSFTLTHNITGFKTGGTGFTACNAFNAMPNVNSIRVEFMGTNFTGYT
jgi:hypothetical protein